MHLQQPTVLTLGVNHVIPDFAGSSEILETLFRPDPREAIYTEVGHWLPLHNLTQPMSILDPSAHGGYKNIYTLVLHILFNIFLAGKSAILY